jgi:hypothetical protein
MPDWRLDQVQHLHGQKLVRLRYKRYSETWDHDHCSACNAKFFEQDGAGTQPEGYTTGPDYSKGREYEWVCVRCFDELKDEMSWSEEAEQNQATIKPRRHQRGSKWRYALWTYGAGAFLMVMLLLYNIYDSGGFQRSHTIAGLLLAAGFYGVLVLLWPIFLVLLLLQLVRVLPMLIGAGCCGL